MTCDTMLSAGEQDGREEDMRLSELLGVIEMGEDIAIYRVGDESSCYEGLAAHVPEELKALGVESVHACEWTIDVLVA